MNLFRGHKKCYFTILPTLIFREFRKAPNFDKGALDVAHKLTKRLSLPTELMEKIDSESGDISRSKFLLRIIRKAYKTKPIKNNDDNSQPESMVLGLHSDCSILDNLYHY
jgi:hypothetical protein